MQPTQIYVIVDTSASFKADGKGSLMRNLVRSLMSAAAKDCYKNRKIRYFSWKDDLNEFFDADEIKFSGRADFKALVGAINAAEDGARFLLFSDGLFGTDSVTSVTPILKNKKSILVPVEVGADADTYVLKNLAAPVKYCYQCVNELSALYDVCFRDFYSEA